LFQCAAKGKEGDHIESQVKIICMDQPTGEEAIVLIPHADGRGPEDQVIHNAGVIDGGE
jgi:hypothetical protein